MSAPSYKISALASIATVLCVTGGLLTEHHFPWNMVFVVAGGALVGWIARRAS
jgi:hypothetical protein